MKQLLFSLLVVCLCLQTSAQAYQSDNLKLNDGSNLTITFIKHGSLKFDYNGKSIFIDPAAEVADFSGFGKADAIIYTHAHSDHFDIPTAKALMSDQTTVLANAEVVTALGAGNALSNGDSTMLFDNIKVVAVAAYNTTEGRNVFHPRKRDNGYIITIGHSRIYVAGDTEVISEMSNLGNVDVAFLPVNQPYTMTVAQAAEAANIIEPKVLYPYHYGKTNIADLVEALKSNAKIEVRIRQMQ